MKSPFRRRRRPKGRAAKPRTVEPEVVDWPSGGTGRTSMMGAIRGDGETGAGFGAGMFEDLHAAFSGAKKIQLQEQEAQRLRRGDDHHVEGDGKARDDLDSGKIRIRRAGPAAAAAGPEGQAASEGPDGAAEPGSGETGSGRA
ncbi:hypothetical protein SAMN04489712_103311 [Thermomonospora echinospora]|uniref:Uncharacterized protein n=1 Tax=Thermomonospora echinospora TaxID=1992 RepID=A0A1H5XMR3_9ACTN|nr:DUF6191 domain-containing protein [Thermomonospora echinospora]SEG12670.1 hypothetical protein SAMN04489712_103311 [Thermomonospora echinospora]